MCSTFKVSIVLLIFITLCEGNRETLDQNEVENNREEIQLRTNKKSRPQMKPTLETIPIEVLNHGQETNFEQNSRPKRNFDYEYPDYGGTSQKSVQNTYHMFEDPMSQKADSVFCFNCFYNMVGSHRTGDEKCSDPFEMVATIECHHQCGKVYQRTNDKDDFFITRGCMKTCKDLKLENGYTTCCRDNYCNTSPSSTTALLQTILAFLTAVALLSL